MTACDHPRRIHADARVLMSYVERRAFHYEDRRFAVVACYACGAKWTETDMERIPAPKPAEEHA